MFTRRSMLAACGAVVLGLVLTAPVHGGGTSLDTTYLTFSGPVALPGVSLGAGTYIFERVSATTPAVVQVLTQDRSRIHYLGFTMRVSRPAGLRANQVVLLEETPRGTPARVKAWFPIGSLRGYEFAYETR